MSGPAGLCGHVGWEAVNSSTGQVCSGQRGLSLTDFEVVVIPPPTTPDVSSFWTGPRTVVADTLQWLSSTGRGSATKSVRLGDGFWLVLRGLRSPTRASRVLLTGRRDRLRLTGDVWFQVDEGGATAAQVKDTGLLELEWEEDADGMQELVTTTTATDVILRLRSARGPLRREPSWQLRILAGSTIRWPRSADGARLVPRLRPDAQPNR